MWTCLFALQVFLGLCTLSSKKANVRDVVIRCWCHEIQRAHLARLEHPNRHMSRKYGICLEKPSEKRFVKWQVFGDRLTDNQDSKWMATQIRGLLTRIGKIFQFTEYTQTHIYIYSGIMHAFRPRVRLFASVFACLLHQLQVILKKASKRPMSPEPRYAKMLSTNIQQEQKRADRSPSKVHLRSRTSHICFFLESRCPGPRYQIGWRY